MKYKQKQFKSDLKFEVHSAHFIKIKSGRGRQKHLSLNNG